MKLTQIIEKIASDVNEQILCQFSPTLYLYIGKTQDLQRRTAEHRDEGLIYTLPLAHGTPQQIAELENDLISALQKVPGCRLVNKESNSNGNPDAEWLYLSLSEYHPNDELYEYDVQFLLGNDYPLELTEDR